MIREPLVLETPQEEKKLEKRLKELRDDISKRERQSVINWTEHRELSQLGRPDHEVATKRATSEAFDYHTGLLKEQFADVQRNVGIIQASRQKIKMIAEAELEVTRLEGEVKCAENSRDELLALQKSIPDRLQFAHWQFNEALRQLSAARDKLTNLQN
jgi:hypothetical protein